MYNIFITSYFCHLLWIGAFEMKTLMEQEIHAQSSVLEHTYRLNVEKIQTLATLIKEKNISYLTFAARGSSDNACLYFKYLCEIKTKYPVAFIHPSIITLYKGKVDYSNTVLICVSQSGQAYDIGKIVDIANAQGALTVSITNDLESPLAKKAMIHLFMGVEKERSIAATKTFTAEMLILKMLVAALENHNSKIPNSIGQLPQFIQQVLSLQPIIDSLADTLIEAKEVFVLTRGINLPIAREIVCKLQETCYLNASSYPLSDFMHGPLALVTSDTQTIILSMDEQTRADTIEMISVLKSLGTKIMILTDSQELAKMSDYSLLLPSSDLDIAPFICAVAGQLLSCCLAIKRGINPDVSRNIKKVTLTK